MRKHLYKAKDLESKKWVYGFYSQFHNRPKVDKPNSHQIFELLERGIPMGGTCIGGLWHIIDENTLCEYIKDDCKGNKVFEHDIVKFEYIDLEIGTIKAQGEIVWHEDSASYLIYLPYECKHFDLRFHSEIEVIGNVFDNE